MDNMSEVYAMLFAYGVMFTVIGVLALLQMLARMVLFHGSFVQHKLTFGEPNKWFWWFLMIPYANIAYALYMDYAWARAYGRTKGFSVFAVFFPTIAMFMMWLQGSLYVGAQPHIFDRS